MRKVFGSSIHRPAGGPLLVAVTVLLATWAGLASSDLATASTKPATDSCRVEEVSRQRLVVEGNKYVYVEPRALESSGENTLLAGWPNYIFSKAADGSRTVEARDSVFGVIVSPGGTAMVIRAPMPSRLIGTVRALARPGGGWDVVFAELVSHSEDLTFRPDSAAAVWYGVLTNDGWESLDSIPVSRLTGIRYASGLDSRLVRRADTLFWAFSALSDSASEVHVLARVGGHWRSELGGGRGSYVDLAYHDTAGLVIAVVRADPSAAQDANSLFVHLRRRGWGWSKRVAVGRLSPTHFPRFSQVRGEVALSWSAESAGRMRHFVTSPNVLAEEADAAVLIDARLAAPLPQAVVTGGGRPIWISHHEPDDGTARKLRVRELIAGHAQTAYETTTPFMATVRATARGRDHILTVGASWDPDSESLASMLLTLRAPACQTG